MRYTRLGKTDLDVSVVALGTWAFGGDWGSFDEDDVREVVDSALEWGITLFDTAQAYGFGASERLLGECLWKRVRRDEVVVATKGGLRMDGENLVRPRRDVTRGRRVSRGRRRTAAGSPPPCR